jgi:hypothetical protein
LKRIILRLAVTAFLVLALAVPAFAQDQFEPGPQVERGPEHANSICSYSGLNEQPTGNTNPDGTPNPADDGRVQSYGDYVKEGLKGTPHAPSPGLLCNGHLFPYPESFPEPE